MAIVTTQNFITNRRIFGKEKELANCHHVFTRIEDGTVKIIIDDIHRLKVTLTFDEFAKIVDKWRESR